MPGNFDRNKSLLVLSKKAIQDMPLTIRAEKHISEYGHLLVTEPLHAFGSKSLPVFAGSLEAPNSSQSTRRAYSHLPGPPDSRMKLRLLAVNHRNNVSSRASLQELM